MSGGKKRKVDAEGRQFQEKWTEEFFIILHNVPCRRSTRIHRAPIRCDCPDCNLGEAGDSSEEWKASPADEPFLKISSTKGLKLTKKKPMSFKIPPRRLKSGLHKCVCGETYSRRDYLFRHMRFSCEMVRSKIRKLPDEDVSSNPFGKFYEKPFKCDCGLKYYHPHNLVRHQKTSCKLLKKGKTEHTIAGTSAEIPQSTETENKISFTCDCGQSFSSRETFKTHRNTNCPRLVRKPSANSMIAAGPKKVVQTRKWGTVTGPPWVCDCGKSSKTIWGYYRHRQHGGCSGANDSSMFSSDCEDVKPIPSTSQHYVPYDALTPEVSLRLVESTETSEYQEYETPIKREPDEENLEELIERQVEPASPRFKCACGRAFANGKQLGGHSRSCRKRLLGGAAYKCYCGLKFPTKKRMIRHISQKHSHQKSEIAFMNTEMTNIPQKIKNPKADKTLVEKPFDCICGKAYANKFLLARHIKNSCGLDLRCPLCGKNHPFKSRLYVHMRDIHGLRPETVYPFRPEDEVTNHPSMPEM